MTYRRHRQALALCPFHLSNPMGSQYNPIEILDIVDVEGDDLAQPSLDPSIVSDSLDHSAAFIEYGKEKNQSTMQMLGKVTNRTLSWSKFKKPYTCISNRNGQ